MEQIIENLEKQCRRLSQSILNRIGWRVIRRIGKEMERAPIEIDDDMAGLGLSFFDQLSIYYQNRTYAELLFGFDDYLDDTIQAEIGKITEIDRLILEHRDLDSLAKGEMEDRIFLDVKKEVSSIIDQHYYTTRIQRFVDRYDLHG